jgi:hypothetical protein
MNNVDTAREPWQRARNSAIVYGDGAMSAQ